MATFKKKTISPAAVAVAEANAASAPIVGDPRTHNEGLALAQPVFHDATTKVGSSQDVVIGQIIEVPVERVRSNPLNPRAVYTSAAVDEMAISLTNNGQRVAALGYQEDDGAIVLIEGETRLRGARAAGIPTLRVEIRAKPASERELYEMARAANVERRDQTPLDDAIRWKELLARKIYPTQSALAKALNLGEDYVSRTLSLAQLPHKIVLGVSEYSELMNHKMLNALRPESTKENENLDVILLSNEQGQRLYRIRQITGQFARRIVCWIRPGDILERGEMYGMIKLGSRTELLVPDSECLEIVANVGDKVSAGSTIFACYRPNAFADTRTSSH